MTLLITRFLLPQASSRSGKMKPRPYLPGSSASANHPRIHARDTTLEMARNTKTAMRPRTAPLYLRIARNPPSRSFPNAIWIRIPAARDAKPAADVRNAFRHYPQFHPADNRHRSVGLPNPPPTPAIRREGSQTPSHPISAPPPGPTPWQDVARQPSARRAHIRDLPRHRPSPKRRHLRPPRPRDPRWPSGDPLRPFPRGGRAGWQTGEQTTPRLNNIVKSKQLGMNRGGANAATSPK